MKKKITTLLIAIGVVATVALPTKALCTDIDGKYQESINDSTGTGYVGVKKSFGGSSTYGFSWIEITNKKKVIFTQLRIGNATFDEKIGRGYVQSQQDSRPGNVRVSEKHGNV